MQAPADGASERDWRGEALVVRDTAGRVTRLPLAGDRVIVGRTAVADVRLDHGMVSRQHAALTRDPAGWWMLKDLGSRNGTLVNGIPVLEKVVGPADQIVIGPFTLWLEVPARPSRAGERGGPPPQTTRVLVAEDPAGGRISTLSEVAPPRVSAAHLTTLTEFGQNLLSMPEERQRLEALCRLLTGPQFRGTWAAVVRVPTASVPTASVPTAGPGEASEAYELACEAYGPADGTSGAGVIAAGVEGGPADGTGASSARGDGGRMGMKDAAQAAGPAPFSSFIPHPSSFEPPGLGSWFNVGGGRGGRGGGSYLSRSVLRAVREKRDAVLAGNTGFPADVQVSIAVDVMPMATVACPLSQAAGPGGDVLDLLYVTLPPEYGTGEWLALAVMAAKQYQQAAGAWAARRQAEAVAAMEQELQRARQIQMRLVPADPRVEGLDLAIGFAPCRSVAGDYVDVLRTSDGRALLVVADVCGKGLAAALTMSSLHTMVHASALAGMRPVELFRGLNAYLCQTLPVECFVTMVAVWLDPRTGRMEMVGAGHPPPLLLTPGGPAVSIRWDSALPLGVDAETFDVHTHAERIERGQMLALYTDGLTELGLDDGTLLGIPGLCTALGGAYGAAERTARDVAAALTRRMNELGGGRQPEDDRTFLLARRE